VAGSEGKMGAAVLCAQACLRSGAGLLSVNIPSCGNNILQTVAPEAMLQLNESEKHISGRIKTGPKTDAEYSAIGIGPGIGTEKETVQALKLLLNEYSGSLVLDADAINILSDNKTWLAFLPKGTILTPHPGEFDRLAGKHTTGFERLNSQRELAAKNGIYIVLKGAHTSIACPDGSVFFNSTGNPGMATGGSGDVLTGFITGLRAQGYHPQAAGILGVYLHGLAGDIAASVQSENGMIAGDIVSQIGGAWRMMGEK
ncbi:MAG: NAD(P)H-hydrate dehydratase, partial [Bacteroidia bacterium]